MKILEAVLAEAVVNRVSAVDAGIVQKNVVAMQRKMRQKGRKEEKRGQGKFVYVVNWEFCVLIVTFLFVTLMLGNCC